MTIADFEDNTAQGFASSTPTIASGGANSSSYYAFITNPASAECTMRKTISTGSLVGYDNIEFYVKLPAANVILSGDASAVFIIDSSGQWSYTSVYQWVDRSSTAWQQVSIPLAKLTRNGDSTPASSGTGTVLDPATANIVGFRFWNGTSYNWSIDEIVVIAAAAAQVANAIFFGAMF